MSRNTITKNLDADISRALQDFEQEMEGIIGALKDDVNDLTREKHDLQDKVDELENDVFEKDRRITELESEVAEYRKEMGIPAYKGEYKEY